MEAHNKEFGLTLAESAPFAFKTPHETEFRLAPCAQLENLTLALTTYLDANHEYALNL